MLSGMNSISRLLIWVVLFTISLSFSGWAFPSMRMFPLFNFLKMKDPAIDLFIISLVIWVWESRSVSLSWGSAASMLYMFDSKGIWWTLGLFSE